MRVRAMFRAIPPAVVVLVAVGIAAAVAYGISHRWLERIAQEDGPVEYGQAVAFFAGAAFFLVRVMRRRGRDLWGLVLGLGLFAVAGEEISWGQRIFGIDTPEGLERSNVQGEFNLHNIEGIHQNVRALGLIVIVGLFVVVPVARMVSPALRRLEDRLRIPPVPMWAVPLALVALAYMVVPRVVDGVVFELDEVGELYVALTAAAYAWSALRERPASASVSDRESLGTEIGDVQVVI